MASPTAPQSSPPSDFARSGETHDRGDIAAFDGTQEQMGSA
jgi:hypothetical protein